MITSIKEAVQATIDAGFKVESKGLLSEVVDYLKRHPKEISEFSMDLQDQYAASDRRTPVIQLAVLLEQALMK